MSAPPPALAAAAAPEDLVDDVAPSDDDDDAESVAMQEPARAPAASPRRPMQPLQQSSSPPQRERSEHKSQVKPFAHQQNSKEAHARGAAAARSGGAVSAASPSRSDTAPLTAAARAKQEADDAALAKELHAAEGRGSADEEEQQPVAASSKRKPAQKRKQNSASSTSSVEEVSAGARSVELKVRRAAATSKRARTNAPPIPSQDSQAEEIEDSDAEMEPRVAKQPQLARLPAVASHVAPAISAPLALSIASLRAPPASAQQGVPPSPSKQKLFADLMQAEEHKQRAAQSKEQQALLAEYAKKTAQADMEVRSRAAAAEQQRAEQARLQAEALAAKTAPLSLVDMVEFYNLHEPSCDNNSGKKVCLRHPNCLHGLGYRKKVAGSVWQDRPHHLKTLGPDLTQAMREEGQNVPAGLKNLGATCYMNALFQVLFMNPHVRNAIYQFRSQRQRGVKPEPAAQAAGDAGNSAAAGGISAAAADTDVVLHEKEEDPDRVVSELQYLFARLEFGRASFEDPSRIVQRLGLKRGEQQDVNEFNNLLLQHLEARLKLTGMRGVATLIDDEFKGTIEHAIECQGCHNRRANQSTFYDLTLQIAGKKTLWQCLLAHMQKEVLEGSNQYKCNKCANEGRNPLQDAHRTTVLRELPPVLNLQLLRFAYDPVSDTKRKLQDNIAIPETLDLAALRDEARIDQLVQKQAFDDAAAALARKKGGAAAAGAIDVDAPMPVSPARSREHEHASPKEAGSSAASSSAAAAASASSGSVYELTAILRHKGSSAFHGHYVAEVRDPRQHNRWWHFDDDKVSELRHFDDAGDDPNAAAGSTKKKKGGAGSKKGAAGKKKKQSKAKQRAVAGGSSSEGDDSDDDGDDAYVEDDGKPKAASSAAAAARKKSADASESEEEQSDEEQKDGGGRDDTIILDDADKAPAAKKTTPLRMDNISSKNAYMLVYTLKGRAPAPPVKRTSLTDEMEQQIRESNEHHMRRIAEYEQKKAALTRLIEQRKSKCEQVWEQATCEPVPLIRTRRDAQQALSPDELMTFAELISDGSRACFDMVVDSRLDDSFFISGPWLRAWVTGQPLLDLEGGRVGSGGTGGKEEDVIDLASAPEDAKTDEERIALMESAELAKKQKLKQEEEERLVQRALAESAADSHMSDVAVAAPAGPSAPSMHGTAGEAPMLSPMDAAAASVVPSAADMAMEQAPPSPVAAAAADATVPAPGGPVVESSTAATADTAAAAGTTATAAPPAPALPPAEPLLFHPLWPGDLQASQSFLLCSHKLPNPNNSDLRRISGAAWKLLQQDNARQKKYLLDELKRSYPDRAVPDAEESKSNLPLALALPCASLCPQCCSVLRDKRESKKQDSERRSTLLAQWSQHKSSHSWSIGSRQPDSMVMNRLWLQKWRTKASSEEVAAKFTQRSDSEDMNEAIKCGHNKLSPDDDSTRLHEIVPKVFWDAMLTFYPASTPFPASGRNSPCATCQRVLESQDAASERWREVQEMDKKLLHGSFLPKLCAEFPLLGKPPGAGERMLVDGRWAAQMKAHLSGKEERIPDKLRNQSLLCEHGKLLFNPIPHDLHEHQQPPPYDVPGTHGGAIALLEVSAWDLLVRSKERYFKDPDALCPVSITTTGSPFGLDSNWNGVHVETHPLPCRPCILAREKVDKVKRQQWQGDVLIHVLQEGASVPEQVADAPGAASRPRRAGKVSRGALEMEPFSSPGVGSASELGHLKLTISETIGIPTGQQEMFYRGRLLHPNSASLAELGVPNHAELFIRRNRDGDDDFTAGFAEPSCASRRRAAGPELGFAGTGLSSAPRRPAAAAAAAAGAPAAAAAGAAGASLPPPRSLSTGAAASDSPAPSNKSASPVAAIWACTSCTFENAPSLDKCSICESRRPPA